MSIRKTMVFAILFLIFIGSSWIGRCFAQDAESLYKNAYIYFSQNNFEKAKETYQQAIEIKPGFWDAHYWLGKTLEMMGDIKGAIAEWKTILENNPTHVEAFKKWRPYATNSVKLSNQERLNLESIFIYQNGSPDVYRKNPWGTIIPYGFFILGQNDFVSAYLSARIFRWTGSQVSSLLYGYADTGYQRAIDLALSSLPEDSEVFFQFLKEVRAYYDKNESVQKKINRLFDVIFAQQAGVTPDEAPNIPRVEIRITAGGVENTSSSEENKNGDAQTSTPSFYIDSGNE